LKKFAKLLNNYKYQIMPNNLMDLIKGQLTGAVMDSLTSQIGGGASL